MLSHKFRAVSVKAASIPLSHLRCEGLGVMEASLTLGGILL